MPSHFSRGALQTSLAAAFALLAGHALAQSQAPNPSGVTLKEVTVTGNPLGGDDLVAPTTQYSGEGLLLRSQSTLGETLANTPGVSSTYFGPNASRPVIRGLDGDRVRILSNSGASLDASNLSYDHAVTADPISIERIEVLRGPAALLYGGNAIGGAVNLIDNRIPTDAMDGVSGKVDLGVATGNRERGGGVAVDGGNSKLGLHVDAFDRHTGDVSVPIELPCTQGGATRTQSRICNSASHVHGGAVGGSLFFDKGYLGASASTYRSDYGTVAEDDVTIGMRSNRYALEGEVRDLAGPFRSIKGQASHSDYAHIEYEGAAPGTRFASRGNDYRLELRQAKLGALDGVIGVQGEDARFSAIGEEAFAPFSRTRQGAIFAFEELATSWGKLTFGARTERVRVASQGNPDVPRFVIGERDFRPLSMALGAQWKLADAWQLTGNLARSERAPKDYELFADGAHVATGAYEIGNPNLGKERSLNADLGLQWKEGANNARVSVFANRFDNYLALMATGATRLSADGSALPEYAYQGVRASFRGFEAGGTWRLHSAPVLDLEWRADAVRATNDDTGQPLPRIAPLRLGATLAWSHEAWGARVGFDHAMRQDRVPPGDLPTAGYTLWTAALTYKMDVRSTSLLWYARVDNAADTLAYSATSILTQSAPGKSPLPGRSLKVGLRAQF
jgi:iron complex outermembrane receptor protein